MNHIAIISSIGLLKNLEITHQTSPMVLHSANQRQGGGDRGSGSSIALLQERFRKLQRTREKRQEMELLKLFPEPENISQRSQLNRYESPVGSMEMMKTRPRSQGCNSLGLGLNTKQAEPEKPAESSQLMDFWKVDSNKNEVDTSLHL
ncbi:hypothetical protein R6Q57_008886 [Mikania cordata]